ncbi:MAG: hypothetical protein E2586_05455, partial [Novosphingobium sp.]|nr:hypothetical protein [Novosphingobium sp.]
TAARSPHRPPRPPHPPRPRAPEAPRPAPPSRPEAEDKGRCSGAKAGDSSRFSKALPRPAKAPEAPPCEEQVARRRVDLLNNSGKDLPCVPDFCG